MASLAKNVSSAKKPHAQLVTTFKQIVFSGNYEMFWQKLTEAASASISPILNYHVTYQMLQQIIDTLINYTIRDKTQEQIEMTTDEKAAIEYIGGYIIKTLIKKISIKNLPNKNDLLYLLFHLLEDPESSTNSEAEPDIMNIKNWCKLIDRGGLHHCTKEFKMTLFSFEKTVKENTLITQDKIPLEIIKHKLKLSTTSTSYWNECFNMNTLTEAKEHLLELIINEYVNLRGFAFAARWMEKYKYNNKRNVVKSKGLRNKLQHEE